MNIYRLGSHNSRFCPHIPGQSMSNLRLWAAIDMQKGLGEIQELKIICQSHYHYQKSLWLLEVIVFMAIYD
jgi:hypothetical protein